LRRARSLALALERTEERAWAETPNVVDGDLRPGVIAEARAPRSGPVGRVVESAVGPGVVGRIDVGHFKWSDGMDLHDCSALDGSEVVRVGRCGDESAGS
jgi:hypothetical protein